MQQYIIYLPTVLKFILCLITIVKYGDRIAQAVWSMLSEDGKIVSSKRVIAITGMYSFVHLFWYVTSTVGAKPLDPNILWAHVVIILSAAAIATMPQIMQLFATIKGKLVSPPAADNTDKQTD
jgi:hypothetical protein